MTAPSSRVIKLGGSLLDLPEWPARFESWLADQPRSSNVLIVGGGKVVDLVREWDEIYRLPDSDAHWLAIRAMSMTAELVAKLLPRARLVYDLLAAVGDEGESDLRILDVYAILRRDDALPHGWHVTSDSIAAHFARMLSAQELVLLKSTAEANELVDEHFTEASRGLPVRIVNLRGVADTRRVP